MTRLITEADVLRLTRGSELRLAPGTLVTPAARDAAMLRGVTLRETSRESAKPAVNQRTGSEHPQGSCGSTCLSTLPDGDYLVEVRGGKPRIRRVEKS